MKVDYKQTATAKKGRDGDRYMAHIADGEMIVPPVISDSLRQRLMAEMEAAGLDPNEYSVGEGMSINPETGLPEFGFFKKVGKFVKKISSVALPVVGGLIGGPVGAAAGGALGGAINGGGLQGIAGGALGGYALGGGGAGLGSFLGATGAGASALGGGILGGAGGILGGGGIKGGLTGAALGGLGGYASGGGFGSLGGFGGDGTISGAEGLDSIGGFTGLDNLTSSAPVAAGTGSSLGGISTSTLLNNLGSAGLGMFANNRAKDDLLEAQQEASANLEPYLNSSFTGADLQNDPGYQFNLAQGNQALDRAQAARGGFYSGGALREAQDYSQGLADSTFGNAFTRFLQDRGQKLGAVGAQNELISQGGNINATNTINNSNLISRGLSGVLGGGGFNASGQGYDSDQLAKILAQFGYGRV